VAGSQVTVVIFLVLFAAAVYIAAGLLLLRWLVGRFRQNAAAKPSRPFRAVRAAVFALAALGILCLLYARFVEPNWLAVERVRIVAPRLPAGARPVRLVLISDLHVEATPRLEEKLPDVIARERPDLILYAGDSLNAAEGLPRFRRCMTRLSAIAPVFAVRGNWDGWLHVPRLEGTGVRELKGEGARLEVRGTTLWIAGIPVGSPVAPDRVLAAAPPGALRIMLCHWPEDAEAAPPGAFDLCCAGHTHGGQITLPFYGMPLAMSEADRKYQRGLYRLGPGWLYVNRGIGMEGGRGIPRVRFGSRPEVTVIDLVPQ